MSVLLLLCALLLSSAFLSGCAVRADDLMQSVVPASEEAGSESVPASFTEAVSTFGWNLFRRMAAVSDGNLLIAPASVHMALSLTMNGANTTTLAEFQSLLSDATLTSKAHNQAARALLTRWNEADGPLSVTNGIWFDDGIEPAAEFLQTNADYYRASAWRLDLQDPGAPDTINKWVETETDGRIRQLVPDTPAAAALYLINTMTLTADWATPFKARNTHPGTFAAPDKPVPVSYMNRTGPIRHIIEDGCISILMPYEGGPYAFFATLPTAGTAPRDLLYDEACCPKAQIRRLLDAPDNTRIALSFPVFSAAYEDKLVDELSLLGLESAFLPEQADFSRMISELSGPLCISDVRHKTFISVDEQGTEAAAATSVELTLAAAPEPGMPVAFDRPFLYGIVDTETGIPLFLGILENPGAVS